KPAEASRARGCRRRNAESRSIIARTGSVGVPVPESVANRHPEDPEVEGERPVLDVVEVVLDPLGEARVSAPGVHLGPARDAGPYAVTQHVLRELLLELADELGPLRPRADQ